MPIVFTNKQFKTLLKLAHLGNCVAGVACTDKGAKEYGDLEKHLFQHAKEYDLEKFVDEKRKGEKGCCPSDAFEENSGVHELLREYDDEMFWENLANRLAVRDVRRQHQSFVESVHPTSEEVQKMIMELIETKKKYDTEFEDVGIDRLGITVNLVRQIGRNERCPCASGKKFKHCCLGK